MLALSSVHKRGAVNASSIGTTNNALNEQERFTLSHYVKAIGHLQPHFSIKDRASFRVALITCVIFICLDFLRGHFKAAQVQNGLMVLHEMQMFSNRNNTTLCLKRNLDSTDEWIVETFARLHLQVELFTHAHQLPCRVLRIESPETSAPVFHSINEAWREMGQMLNKISLLTHQSRQQAECCLDSTRKSSWLVEHQESIQRELTQWLEKYMAFTSGLQVHFSAQEEKGYQLLYTYHTMATIMIYTCVQSNDEMAFDFCTEKFVLLLQQMMNLSTKTLTTSPVQALPGDMPLSIVDVGWIPPLYYTALKCRESRIRHQALRLLDSTSHREGIWDSKTAACVARKVIGMEERDFYKETGLVDDSSLLSLPRTEDLSLPILPDFYRIHDVEVVLSGDPMNKILLYCKLREEGLGSRVVISEFDVHTQRWLDSTHGQ